MQDVLEKTVQIVAGNAVLNYIANTCITVSGVIVFLLLIRPFLKRLPRIGMYLLWFMVVVRLLCPVTISGIYRILPKQVEQTVAETGRNFSIDGVAERIQGNAEAEYAAQESHYRLPAEEATGKSSGMFLDGLDNTKKDVQTGSSTAGSDLTGTAQGESSQGQKSTVWSEAEILLLVWGAGVLLCWLYLAISLLKTRFRYADARCLWDNVYTHPLIDGSFVAGIFDPKIYLPEGLSEEDQRYILCHERIHIRRRDYLIKPFVFAVYSLLWLNPLVWIAYHFMMKDMEISCDEAVLKTLGSGARARYSYLLLSMTESGRRYSGHSPAFSAGTIRERILTVMKYQRPTALVTVLGLVVVAVCGMGIASEPQSTQQSADSGEKIYVEQTVSCFAQSVYGAGKCAQYHLPQMDSEGCLVDLPTVYRFLDDEKYSTEKVKMVEGDWQSEDVLWKAEYEKFVGDKKEVTELSNYQYAGDGYLYLTVSQYSMERKKYESDTEKYKDSFYLKEIHFLKVDETAGTVTEITVPKENAGRGIVPEKIYVLGNGSLYIVNTQDICGIYSQITGEKLAQGSYLASSCLTGIVPGDGFYCYGVSDPQSGQMKIEVYDENGKQTDTLSTGVDVKETDFGTNKEYVGAALGTAGTKILLATAEGIFEADADGGEFVKTVDAARDNLYYLAEDGGLVSNGLFKGSGGDYYLILYKGGSDSREYHLCRYCPQQ